MKNIFKSSVITALGLFMLFSIGRHGHSQTQTPPGIYTRNYDNDRSGDNLNETILTPNYLLTKGIVLRTVIPVNGDARGMESQPLILPGVKLANGTVHNILVLPSMANQVRGVDAETGADIWDVTLCNPALGGASIDMHLINQHWGVLSTGVIQPSTQRVYMVAWCSANGTPQSAQHYVYSLNLKDGTQANPPVLVTGTSGNQTYDSQMRKQRSSLVIEPIDGHDTIFWASGTVLETGNGAAGWMFAYDCDSNKITAVLAMSQGRGAGIWMGGQGLAADSSKYLYAITGNGSFNAAGDWGESIVKIQYTSPYTSGSGKGALTVVNNWTPYSDAGRTGQNPQLSSPTLTVSANKLSGVSAVTQEMQATPMPVGGGMKINMAGAKVVASGPTTETGGVAQLYYPTGQGPDAAWNDEDLGSGGGTLIEQYKVYLATGKDGIAYPVNTANMGKTQPADFANAAANCAKLAAPPVWATASPGPVNPCPQDQTVLDFLPWGKTRHLHMTPVQYMSPVDGLHIFVWGENSQLHDWKMNNTGVMSYVAQSNELASVNVTRSPGGMPGGFCTLSSNQNKLGTAILWCSIPLGDANAQIVNGRLLAYDPENIITNADGTKSLKVLWDSAQWGINYVFNKFMPPVVWNGYVYLPNYAGGVLLFAPNN